MHKDAVMDLYLRMQTDKELNEYVPMCSVKPLAVLLCYNQQFEIVKKLRQATKKVVAHIDATGSTVKDVNKDDKKLLLYAIAVNSPIAGEPPVAVCQFVLSDHTQGSIEHALSYFIQKLVLHIRSYDISRF